MNVAVTGVTGFLGSAIADLLRMRGYRVRGISRSAGSELRGRGIEPYAVDLSDRDRLTTVFHGCDAVIHTAAKTGIWGAERDYYRVNVLGTAQVVAACRAAGVTRLIVTSSPSVVHHGGDLDGVNESIPYPRRFLAPYPKTKAEAEQLALAANGPGLAVVALRPHLVWGANDPHLIPRLVQGRLRGTLRRIGHDDKLVDSTYIDNAAYAHWLALERLSNYDSPPAGRAYFIAQGEPTPLWSLIDRFLESAGAPRLDQTKIIGYRAALTLATLLETVYKLPGFKSEPPLTRFVVHQLATAHWFDLTAARRDLGYKPIVTLDQGLERLRAARGESTRASARFDLPLESAIHAAETNRCRAEGNHPLPLGDVHHLADQASAS